MQRDTPRHLQYPCCFGRCSVKTKRHTFQATQANTIYFTLVFNGTVSQVKKGNPWIKMYPYFKQSDIYKTYKQQQCMSDI